MDSMGINWQNFGWTLAGAFVFGVVFAALVRWASRRRLVGQTAWAVVVGVSVTLLFMVPVLGLTVVAIEFCYFAGTGAPMVVEYILRVQREIDEDKAKSQDLAKDLLK